MTVLYDYDSMFYKAVYKIVDRQTIKNWFAAGKDKEWIRNEILQMSMNRLQNMQDRIFLEIEETGIIITDIEYYVTDCKNSFRKKLTPNYKANRKPNKWVNAIRKEWIEKDFAISHDELESDDLIANRAKELKDEYIILSLDKDMKTIPGLHFNYYVKKVGETKEMVGLSFVTKEEAIYNFYFQMLVGDNADNISGVKGIGEVKAKKILANTNIANIHSIVLDEYKKAYDLEAYDIFNLNYRLLKLGL